MRHEKLIHDDMFSIISEKKQTSKGPVLGLVRIFENGILNTDQTEDGWLTNMTIGTGRQFAAQKLFGLEKDLRLTISPTSSSINPSNFKIDSFGIGKGGSTIDPSETITILSPSVCNLGLNKPLAINNLAIDDSHTNKNVVKKIVSSLSASSPVGSIELITSSSDEYKSCTSTYYTIVKCTCIVGPNEPMGLVVGSAEKVDEAMLFATSASIDEAAVVIPFAHICFAPKYIEPESILTIEWNVIF